MGIIGRDVDVYHGAGEESVVLMLVLNLVRLWNRN